MNHDLRKIVQKYDWDLYLSRPYSFLMSTWWHEVYSSKLIKNLINASAAKSLLISGKGVVTKYVSKHEWERVEKNFTTLIADNPQIFLSWLIRAEKLFLKVDKLVKAKKRLSTKQALKMLNLVTIYGTFVPLFGGRWLKENNPMYERLQKKIVALRTKSYYPIVYAKLFMPSLKELFKKNNILIAYIEYATLREILSGNFSSIKERKKQLKTGKEFVFFSDGRNEQVFIVNASENVFDHAPQRNGNSIKGQSGYKGKVKGKVVILNSLKLPAIKNFKQGNILVAVSTNPSLLPIIHKAAAIVTDEGGITSHAAIIARELKKPCIIGTNNATKTFKDGDIVEVDATKGVIRKVSQSY